MEYLEGLSVVNLALNLPGPAASRRLARMGARVVKVEPPTGDPMQRYSAQWYRELTAEQTVVKLDLKSAGDRAGLDELLDTADLVVTSSRPAALERLGLGWDALHARFPRLCQVAIVGHAPPHDNVAGHDLTYQATLGLLTPPHLPRVLLADLVGAERAVGAALGLLFRRDRTEVSDYAQVTLEEAAETMAAPVRFGLTTPGALLGGGTPEYNIYHTKDEWIAVAALEPHFKKRLEDTLGMGVRTVEQYRRSFRKMPAAHWLQIGRELDIPIARIPLR